MNARQRSAGGAAFYIEGIAFWAPTLPGWDAARAAFRGEGGLADPPAKRPAPEVLAPAERRRAPDSVALALEVATASVRASGRDAAALPSVFASVHGDLAVSDYMCKTLASEPTAISPTKFHNSVHNAAAGYWTIGTGCRRASTALTAYDTTFAAGLLEAASQVAADGEAVLFVAFDVESTGALASVTASRGLLAAAFVVAPEPGERTVAGFDWSIVHAAAAPPARSPAAVSLAGNAMAGALPFFERIAAAERSASTPIALPISPRLTLSLVARPVDARAAA